MRLAIVERIACDDDRHVRRDDGADGRREDRTVGGEDEARTQQVDDLAQFSEIMRDGRIGRRDRRVGDADVDGREPQERVFDVVAGEDEQRPVGPQSGIEQSLPETFDRRENLRVGEAAPGARGVALREVGARRCVGGPMDEALGQARGIGRQRRRLSHVDDAVFGAHDIDRPVVGPRGPQRIIRARDSADRQIRHCLPLAAAEASAAPSTLSTRSVDGGLLLTARVDTPAGYCPLGNK